MENLHTKFKNLKEAYLEHPYPEINERKKLILSIKKQLLKYEKDLYKALSDDFGTRSHFDSMISDFLPTVQFIGHTCKNLKKWMKPSKRNSGLLLAPSKIKIMYQPLGVIGIIVPWNFPLYLSFPPLITALAAGNKAMLKLSEFTPHTNQVIKKILEPFQSEIIIIEGDASAGAEFSNLPFDHILFTGSTAVGKLVAQSAAKNLTPVTLELGGKSPFIVGKNSNIEKAVKTALPGKCINAGQICVAPDYIFLQEEKVDQFIKLFQREFQDIYEKKNENFNYTGILNGHHKKRLTDWIKDAESKGAKIHKIAAKFEEHPNHFLPVLVTDVDDSMILLQEEIFGPILPIIPYKKIEDAIKYIQNRSRPLTLYIQSDDKEEINKVLLNTHSGGVAINDTLVQVAADDAPFGGIGASGMGHYHGHEGFLSFSKAKTILSTPSFLPRTFYILKYREKLFPLLRKFFVK